MESSSSRLFGFPTEPPFQLGKSRFPQQTFFGRYLHFLDVIDPTTLFASQKKLDESVALLERFKRGERGFATDGELWRAQKIKQAILHPDTCKRILPPFRMSGFVPFGWITVTGMLLPNPSITTLLFWQWMNQSHNACVNYANRNASQPQPVSKFVAAYTVAVTAACSVSLGLSSLLKRFTLLPPSTRLLLSRFVPLPATSLASSLNVIAMRGGELQSGIAVYEEGGKVVGVSKTAAKRAVFETTATRAFLPVPLLLLPPCVMPFLERYRWVKSTVPRHIFVQALVCTLSFAFSLPIALALFPHESAIPTSSLEPEIQANTKEDKLFFNKGL